MTHEWIRGLNPDREIWLYTNSVMGIVVTNDKRFDVIELFRESRPGNFSCVETFDTLLEAQHYVEKLVGSSYWPD